MKTWQDRWDEAADDERRRMEARTAAELLYDIEEGRFGNYYVIWYVIASKTTLDEAGWTLFRILVGNVDYLYRYHCVTALLLLMGEGAIAPVDLSADHPGRRSALTEVRLRLARMIGDDRSFPGKGCSEGGG